MHPFHPVINQYTNVIFSTDLSPQTTEYMNKTLMEKSSHTFPCAVNATPSAMVHWTFTPTVEEVSCSNAYVLSLA